MNKIFLHRLTLFLVLLGVWYVLSGVNSWAFLGFGIFSAGFALLVSARMNVTDREGHPLHLSLTAPVYWLWLFKEMIKSALTVTAMVWRRDMRLSPQMTWIPQNQINDLGRTIYANSITLTPGTVSVDVEENRILVHALESASIDDLRKGDMDARVRKLIGKEKQA